MVVLLAAVRVAVRCVAGRNSTDWSCLVTVTVQSGTASCL